MVRMKCIKCGGDVPTTSRSVKYCSLHCSKLYLKAQWKKRTADHQRAYAREWRRAKHGGNRPLTWPAKHRTDQCLNCGARTDLQAAHIKPLRVGGTHETLITLCRRHHMQFDNLLRDFWDEGFEIRRSVL